MFFDSILDKVNEEVVNTHKIENVKLKPLVKEFPNIYVQCREKSTIKKYQSYFSSWQEWWLSVSIQALAVKQFNVALYTTRFLVSSDRIFFSCHKFLPFIIESRESMQITSG